MASTTPPPPAFTAPSAPVFSYAQAAKGRAAVTAASITLSNQTTSGSTTPAKDTNSTVETPSASINGTATGSEGGDKDRGINRGYDSVTKSDPLGVGMESESRTATLVNSIPASPSFGSDSTSTLPKEDDLTLPNTVAPSESVWDRHSQPVNGVEKPLESPEGRRGKKGKRQKHAEKEAEREAEKQKEEEKKLEMLVAAPLPTVNIWQQRKEAQALKTKPSPLINQTPEPPTEISDINDPAAKQIEPKRKGKSTPSDDGEKVSSVGIALGTKEPSNIIKGQKKGYEGASKGKEDGANKRVGPRGARLNENEKLVSNQLPPPVEDAMSWPTPDIALEEEKRKALEREKSEKEKDKEDRDEASSNKPRPKEKWVAVPYVPSVNFATPLPASRGGRGRGGGRGGRDSNGRSTHTSAGGNNAERGTNGSPITSPLEAENRGRGSSTTTRATSLPPNSNKRPSNDTRPTGKTSNLPNAEKAKVSQASQTFKGESNSNGDSKRASVVSQLDQPLENQQGRSDGSKTSRSESAQGPLSDNILKSGSGDRRSESNFRGAEQFKDGVNFGKEPGQPRDRADGRVDRGRGGFRARGGHTFPNGTSQPPAPYTNGHGSQPPNGYVPRQNSTPYTPSMQQPLFPTQYVQTSTRGGRGGGSRSHSIPNNNMYGSRYPTNINPQMPPLQTPNSIYEYQQPPLQTMSAGPFGSYPDPLQYPLVGLVIMQLEYYFSIDNLCKDVYLRKHMDTQGFVFLNFIAGFKRIQALTQEIELLRFACMESALIDVIKGEDGIDRLRRREGWEKWVLAMEERDQSVRTYGPTYHTRYESQRQSQHTAMMQSYPAMSPPAFSPTSADPRFLAQYTNGSPIATIVNGSSGNQHPETPLSAAVPDFAPSHPPLDGTVDSLQEETTFSDEEVSKLKIVFAPTKANEVFKAEPSQNASSRTFSNGSIDGRSIAEELHDDPRQGRGLTNGSSASEISPDSLRRSRSPFSPSSPTNSNINSEPAVMWAKDQRQQAPISKDSTAELYLDVLARALSDRELSAPGETNAEMKQLYNFWSDFLCKKFNPTMYREFRKYAMADAEANAMEGVRRLISYYDETLNNRSKVISDELARDYVDLVVREKFTTEPGFDRPAFRKLRTSWRNGALDVKSRKKIDNLVNPTLKEELNR